MASAKPAAQKTELQKQRGFYAWVERVGNKVPHPVYLFISFLCVTLIASWVLSRFGVQATNPVNGELVEITNMLSAEKIGEFLSNMGKNFATFSPMLTVPICTLGLGVANHSGLLKSTLKLAGLSHSKFMMTLVVCFIGVNANLVGDAAYIVFPPLVAILYQGMGRNPLTGLFSAFASVACGFGANLLVGSGDATLSGMTEAAAALVDPNYIATPVMSYYYLFVSTFLMTIVCTFITLKIVEPRMDRSGLAQNALSREFAEDTKPSALELKGMKTALLAFVLFFVGVAVMCLDGMPFAAPEGKSILYGKLFKSIPTIIFLMFYISGYAYGKVTGSIKKFSDTFAMMQKELKTLSSFFLIIFFCSQFLTVFKDSNIGTLIAVKGSELLNGVGLPAPILMALFVVVVIFTNLFMTSSSSKWAILSIIFVPMFMYLNISPATVQAAYRMGDGLTNNLAPTSAYVATMLAFAQDYDDRAQMGTLISYMLPYTLIGGLIWILFLVLWIFLGIPMGPGYPSLL